MGRGRVPALFCRGMMYITAYPLTQRINPMRKLLLTTAAIAAAIVDTQYPRYQKITEIIS